MSFLNKKIINFDPEIFGLDLSDLSIKVFQMEKEGQIDKARSYFTLNIASGIIDDGRIVDKEKAANAIKEAVRMAGPKKIKTKKVVCSIPESKAFLRIISIPKMNEEEAGEAVKWEMEANIPLPIEQVYFDWQFLDLNESQKDKQDVLTVAVSKEIVDDLMDVLQKSGLEVYGLEAESIASIRSLIDNREPAENSSILVDLGAKRTSFIVTEGNRPYFTSSIPFSSEAINDSISKNLNISQEEAEKIKISQGLAGLDETSPIFSSIKYLLENLSAEIEKTIDFYSDISKKSKGIKKIIITGGGANLTGLAEYLSGRLGKEVIIGDPWINLNLGNNLPAIAKPSAVSYATVIGLALKGVTYGH